MLHRCAAIFRKALVPSMFALTLALVPPGGAQAPRAVSAGSIPFDFEIGSTHLKAGQYRFVANTSFLFAREAGGQYAQSVVMAGDGATRSATSTAIFHRYGNQYFLRELRAAGQRGYLFLPESKQEQRVRRDMARALAQAPAPGEAIAALASPQQPQ